MIDLLIDKNRSLLGNEIAFSILRAYIPLKFHRIASGTRCFDWFVPKKWVMKKAVLKDMSGNIILDASNNILNVINYSNSYEGIVTKTELDEHLHIGETYIPYRTAYYSDVWGFCMTREQYSQLNDAEYKVEIETGFVDSHMVLGECCIKGRTDKEVILTSYICHPNQANDGLSGVELLVNLYHKLIQTSNKYTYRLFFIPETIGSLALLSQKIVVPERVEYGMVATCVGVGDRLNYKKTFCNHSIDNTVLTNFDVDVHDFKPWGSDERQFSSPKVRIPMCSLMRTRWQDFKEYHTSGDNLDLISMKKIIETAEIYYEIVKKYESEKLYIIRHEGGEPFLSKYDLYRKVGVPGHTTVGKIINWILFFSDGKNTVSDMVVKSGRSKIHIQKYIDMLINHNIIEEVK